MKYWRSRFLLLPVKSTPLNPSVKETKKDQGNQMLKIEGFLRFLENINKIRRTYTSRPLFVCFGSFFFREMLLYAYIPLWRGYRISKRFEKSNLQVVWNMGYLRNIKFKKLFNRGRSRRVAKFLSESNSFHIKWKAIKMLSCKNFVKFFDPSLI